MPGVNKPVPMADCLNCGLGIADNDDLRQSIMQPGPMLADMLLRGMQEFKCVELNSLNSHEENDMMLPVNATQNELISPVVTNDASHCAKNKLDKKFKSNSVEYEMTIKNRSESDIEQSKVPSNETQMYFLPISYNKRNPWRRIIGFHTSGNELKSSTYPARSSVKKLRFAQAKKPLNYLYSYFSVEILDCDDKGSITVGVCRKDYPSKVAPGKNAGSLGYCSDSGSISIRDSVLLDGPTFAKGDIVGCGIIYPSHYKRYADLSTDDNSDGMTDVVLTSLLNTNAKSMDFVCNVLNLNLENDTSDSDSSCSMFGINTKKTDVDEHDYYNENFVESRMQVEVYFTHNMHVVGKVLSYVPVGGFYPTIHVFSSTAVKMSVDLNPPSS